MSDSETFPFLCPGCAQLMVAEFSTTGELVDCPSCGREVQIPEPSPDPQVPSLGLVPEELAGATLVEGLEPAGQSSEAAEPPATFEFSCPQCEAPLMAYRPDAGQSTQCPSCEGVLRIPEPLPLSGHGGADHEQAHGAWQDARSEAARAQFSDEAEEADAGPAGEETRPLPEAGASSGGEEAQDEEAAELLAALEEDFEAVTRMKRKPSTHQQPPQEPPLSAPQEEQGAEQPELATSKSGGASSSSLSSSSSAASADSAPIPACEALSQEEVRGIHRWLLKFARSAAAHPQAPEILVYKAKEAEAPVAFALFARKEALALAFTAAHVLVSFPEKKQLKLLRPSAVKIQAKFRKAVPASDEATEKAGLARVRFSEKRQEGKPEPCAEVRFSFAADSSEERTALRLRTLLQNWMSSHPMLGQR